MSRNPGPLPRSASLAAPLLLYLVLFLALPLGAAVLLSLTDPIRQTAPSLRAFRSLLDDRLFWSALFGNLLVPAVSVLVELLLGTMLALALSRPLPARRTLRTLVLLPYALPEIVFLLTMRYTFAPRGYANGLLAQAGLPSIDWLHPGSWLAYATVIAVDAWHVTPLVYLMVLAALRRLPEDVLDAAELDGAGGWRRVVYVIVPMLAPTLRAALLLRGLDGLRIFATPLVLTGVEGVPVLSSYAYHQWADYGADQTAAAAALVLALLCVLVAAPLIRHPPGEGLGARG